jgi:hypothetical protein
MQDNVDACTLRLQSGVCMCTTATVLAEVLLVVDVESNERITLVTNADQVRIGFLRCIIWKCELACDCSSCSRLPFARLISPVPKFRQHNP